MRKRLDRARNPFFEHAEAEYLLAWRDGAPGRAHQRPHRPPLQRVPGQPLGDVRLLRVRGLRTRPPTRCSRRPPSWLRERDRDRMVGPMDFTTNDECGLLIEGHERPPIILSSLAPPLLPRAARGRGAREGDGPADVEPAHQRPRRACATRSGGSAGRVESEHGIVVRPMRKRDLDAEVTRFLEVYNAAWERNWAAVPLTEEEVRHYAKDLRPILDENWAFIAERADTGEVVGAALTLPDYNQVLAHLHGRLLPFGWAKALYWRRQDRRRARLRARRQARLPAHRRRRALLPAALRGRRADAARRAARWAGSSRPTAPMNRAMEGMGGRDRAPLPRLRTKPRLICETGRPVTGTRV